MTNSALAAASAVNQDRLWRRHMEMAEIGATAKGGVNRPALSPLDAESRLRLIGWAKARGFTAAQDAMGNLFIRRAGRDDDLPPVVAGSHLDSQPTGGKFDGAFGTLAAFEMLEALEDAGIETEHPVECVAWTNEEGSRFQPGTTGSLVFTGSLPLDKARAVVDWDGVTAGTALDAVLATTADLPMRPFGFPMAAHLECHIEQGPRLETAGLPIGIVTGAQGSRRYVVEVTGEEAHAGTTPEANRKDALKAAARMIVALDAAFADPDDVLRFTVGRLEASPGSPNTVPGHVRFTIDFRHPETATIERLTAEIGPVCEREAGRCAVRVTQLNDSPPVVFDPKVVGAVRESAEALGLGAMELLSGAGHDAMKLQSHCPSGMIFIPCEKGISHNEAENATPEDVAAGARVLTAAVVRLAG